MSGLFNTTQQGGGALGVAALSTIAAARTAHMRATGLTIPSALTSGYDLAFGIAACLGAAAIIVALTVLRPHRALCSSNMRSIVADREQARP